MSYDFSSLQKFVCFLGPVRTGHTLVGSLLSAHPDAAISIEINPLLRFIREESQEKIFTRIFDYCENGGEKEKGNYFYDIPNTYQRNVDNIKVIGDTMAGFKYMKILCERYTLKNFGKFINLPVYFLLVLRNPFDVIQSSHMMNRNGIKKNTDMFFESVMKSIKIQKRKYKVLVIYLEKLIAKHYLELQRILKFLDLRYDSEYLQTCSNFIFSEPRKVFNENEWSKYQIIKVSKFINSTPILRYYRK